MLSRTALHDPHIAREIIAEVDERADDGGCQLRRTVAFSPPTPDKHANDVEEVAPLRGGAK